MQVPDILIGRTRYPHHAPDTRLASKVTKQHAQQLLAIQTIGLPVTSMPFDFDTRRIDHQVNHSLLAEEAMQPKAIATRFITTPYWSVVRQAETLFGFANLIPEQVQPTRGHRPQARTRAQAGAERHLPLSPTEFKSNVQSGCRRATMLVRGR